MLQELPVDLILARGWRALRLWRGWDKDRTVPMAGFGLGDNCYFPFRRETPWDEIGPGVSTAKSSRFRHVRGERYLASTEHWIFILMFIVLRVVYTTCTHAARGLGCGTVISSAGLRTGERSVGLAATLIQAHPSVGLSS